MNLVLVEVNGRLALTSKFFGGPRKPQNMPRVDSISHLAPASLGTHKKEATFWVDEEWTQLEEKNTKQIQKMDPPGKKKMGGEGCRRRAVAFFRPR